MARVDLTFEDCLNPILTLESETTVPRLYLTFVRFPGKRIIPSFRPSLQVRWNLSVTNFVLLQTVGLFYPYGRHVSLMFLCSHTYTSIPYPFEIITLTIPPNTGNTSLSLLYLVNFFCFDWSQKLIHILSGPSFKFSISICHFSEGKGELEVGGSKGGVSFGYVNSLGYRTYTKISIKHVLDRHWSGESMFTSGQYDRTGQRTKKKVGNVQNPL